MQFSTFPPSRSSRSAAADVDELFGTAVPLGFGDFEAEYAAIRRGTALLDLESTGPIVIDERAVHLFQDAYSRDIEFLYPGQCALGLLLDDDASVVDMPIVHRLEQGLLVTAAFGRVHHLVAALVDLGVPEGAIWQGSSIALGVEGPQAQDLVEQAIDPRLGGLAYRSWTSARWNDADLVVSRMGYTGEFGYQLFPPVDVAADLWNELQEAGALPTGFAALETAMIEVRQPLMHRERVGDGVVAAGLNWLVDIEKPSFRGRDTLLEGWQSERRRSVCIRTDQAAMSLVPGMPLRSADTHVGDIVYSCFSPGVGAEIGIARVERDWAASGVAFLAGNPGVPVRSTSSPFLVPRSWTGDST